MRAAAVVDAAPPRSTDTELLSRRDIGVLTAGVALIAVAIVVGAVLVSRGVPVLAGLPPLVGHWRPHVGPGTVPAVVLAVLLVGNGPALAARLRWLGLLGAAWAATVAWTLALALVDGWATGVSGRLATPYEYLSALPSLPAWGELLRTFTDRIPADAPGSWSTHVAGHPPGAVLVFAVLDRIGLAGGGPAGVLCIAVGASAVVAVAVAVRRLAGEDTARALLPFLVLAPGAIWVGVSADAVFLGVSAWGIALLALATGSRGAHHDVAALGAGLALGGALFLSYGLVLLVLPAAAVLLVGGRWRTLAVAAIGVLAVVAAFAAAGFRWWEGYLAVRPRYYAGYGGDRPYGYWVWADIAALLLMLGPAVWVGAARLLPVGPAALRALLRPTARRPAGAGGRPRSPVTTPGLVLLVGSVAVAVAAAALSGMSKAEVERIWLPFAAWLAVACVALPARSRTRWLAVQALTALLLQHLVLTPW